MAGELVRLKWRLLVNGVKSLCVTKLDVLDELDRIKICTGYSLDGVRHVFSHSARLIADWGTTGPDFGYGSGGAHLHPWAANTRYVCSRMRVEFVAVISSGDSGYTVSTGDSS